MDSHEGSVASSDAVEGILLKYRKDFSLPFRLAVIITNVVTFIAVCVINGLSNGVIGNKTVGEVSDDIPVLLTPAGLAFSVWGVIYFFCAVFCIYQCLPFQKRNALIFERVGFWFALSNLFNIIWICVWVYEYIHAATVFLPLILISLLVAYVRLGVGRRFTTVADFWCVDMPFSLYCAWTTVATILNVSISLEYAGWDGAPSPEMWAVIMLVIATIIGILVLIFHRDAAFLGVLSWAICNIAGKQSDNGVVFPAALTLGIFLGVLSLGTALVRIAIFLRQYQRYNSVYLYNKDEAIQLQKA